MQFPDIEIDEAEFGLGHVQAHNVYLKGIPFKEEAPEKILSPIITTNIGGEKKNKPSDHSSLPLKDTGACTNGIPATSSISIQAASSPPKAPITNKPLSSTLKPQIASASPPA